MTEQEIIRGCKRGNEKAYRQLVEQYAPMLKGVCVRYMKDTTLADDILQETFIRIFQNIHQYTGDGAFGGWLRKIAVTTALKALRKNTLPTEELDLKLNGHDSGEIDQEVRFNVEEIIQTINTLPEHYRHVFNLYIVEGYSHAEIAALLEINESTSRARLTRAREMVRALFTKKNITHEIV